MFTLHWIDTNVFTLPTVGLATMAAWTSCILFSTAVASWVQHDATHLPRRDYSMAVGHYNDVIYLLYVPDLTLSFFPIIGKNIHSSIYTTCIHRGGKMNAKQLVKYSIVNDQFVDYGTIYSALMGNSLGEFGYGGYYSQLNSTMLYTITPISWSTFNVQYISAYNLKDLSYQQLHPSIPTNVGQYACLASSEIPSPRLYVTGGQTQNYDRLDDLRVLDLYQSHWLTNMPSMNQTRSSHGCIVVDERLFVVGGDNVTAVESINVMDIESASWGTIGNLPDYRSRFGQVVEFDKVIYVIGGAHSYDSGSNRDTVSIRMTKPYSVLMIDTKSGDISLHSDPLPYSVTGMATVIVDNTIYGFGGYNGSSHRSMNTWISYKMLSDETPTESDSKFYIHCHSKRCCHRQNDARSCNVLSNHCDRGGIAAWCFALWYPSPSPMLQVLSGPME